MSEVTDNNAIGWVWATVAATFVFTFVNYTKIEDIHEQLAEVQRENNQLKTTINERLSSLEQKDVVRSRSISQLNNNLSSFVQKALNTAINPTVEQATNQIVKNLANKTFSNIKVRNLTLVDTQNKKKASFNYASGLSLYYDNGKTSYNLGPSDTKTYRAVYYSEDGSRRLALGISKDKSGSAIGFFDKNEKIRTAMGYSHKQDNSYMGLYGPNGTSKLAAIHNQSSHQTGYLIHDTAGNLRLGSGIFQNNAVVIELYQANNNMGFATQVPYAGYTRNYTNTTPGTDAWNVLTIFSTIKSLFKK